MVPPLTKLSQESSIVCNNVINTGDIDPPCITDDLVPLCVCMAELPSSSVLPRLYLLRFQIHWIFFRRDSGEAMGVVMGLDDEEARSSATKSEGNDNHEDGVPPEMAPLLVKTGSDAPFLHFGKR